jgi:pilus assembly protein FimV
LVDFCRHASEPFRLNAALGQLSDAYVAQENYPRAEELLVELVDRNKNDERLVERLNQLRARSGGAPVPITATTEVTPAAPIVSEPAAVPEPADDATVNLTPVVAPTIVEETVDEDTQRYIAQALTDVDLFSSYGLTQKATHLLENVLQRAPRHTPTLERLLDLHLGAGNDRRTAELAAQLEQIHRERNDHVNADRFGELRRRYSKVAGISESELPAAPAMVSPAPGTPAVAPAAAPGTWSHEVNPQVGTPEAHEAAASTASVPAAPAPAEPPPFEIAPAPVTASASPVHAAAPIEFEIPLVDLDAVTHEPQEISLDAIVTETAQVSAVESPALSGELDLSDEWAAASSEVQEEQPAPGAQELVAPLEFDPIVEPEREAVVLQPAAKIPEDETIAEIRRAANEAVAQLGSEPEIVDEEPDHATGVKAFEIDSNLAQTDLNEDVLAAEPAADNADALPASLMEFLNEPAPEIVEAPQAELEIELTPEPAHAQRNGEAKTTDEFLSDLAAEFDDLEAPPVESVQASSNQSAPASQPDKIHSQLQEVFAETVPAPKASSVALPPAASIPEPPMSTARVSRPVEAAAALNSVEHMNELAEVFQEFRSELGEMSDEDEDLETHYNLGIAYREMGLLDEAIGEFQKVAKAIQKGKPFRYEMNCSTMLGLSFMDKGEPMVASLWYKRALTTPDLEEESILALQYDLGLALESAGESDAALDSFRQVYAANIDYRDVADRIATLQKQ